VKREFVSAGKYSPMDLYIWIILLLKEDGTNAKPTYLVSVFYLVEKFCCDLHVSVMIVCSIINVCTC
jgi:hypothetical protein